MNRLTPAAAACLLALAFAAPRAAQGQTPPAPQEQTATPEAGEAEASLRERQEQREIDRRHLRSLKTGPRVAALPPALAVAFKPVELPEGEGAWAVQVISRGGWSGAGRGDVTVRSDGSVSCRLPELAVCVEKDPAGGVARLSRLVAAAAPSGWKAPAAAGCFDCYVTLLVVQRRGPEGQAEVYTAHWDDANAAAAPADALRIHEAALALTTARK